MRSLPYNEVSAGSAVALETTPKKDIIDIVDIEDIEIS